MNKAANNEWKIQQKVLKTILENQIIEKGEKVLVGVSGGPDSVCLLHVLLSLSDCLDIKLWAIHINHMLRAQEAAEDEAYTADLCRRMGIPLAIRHVDVAEIARESGMSLEEAGRKARYSEFRKYADTIGADKIAVAHNRNDQAETVMMHIIRGAGMAGLVGMVYKSGALIRPLLNIYRSEIEQYCKAVGISPRTDSTNLISVFTRNKVRLELFPYIDRNFNANVTDSLCRLSSLAFIDNEYLEQCALDAYTKCKIETGDERVALELEHIGKLHPAILSRVMRYAIADAAGGVKGIGNVHYLSILELIKKGKTGAHIELPGGLSANISYGTINILHKQIKKSPFIKKSEAHHDFDRSIAIPGITEVKELGAIVKASIEPVENIDNYGTMGYNSLVQFFDYDSLKRGINIRNRRNGDIFKPVGSGGTKKLKKYFIDCKIPRELRYNIPLICAGNEVVWIIGYKISDKFKVTENTRNVLRTEYIRRIVL